jgi:GntR family transcriptional regulator, transcriptional repressor for pyruvate dehydrogenase complex
VGVTEDDPLVHDRGDRVTSKRGVRVAEVLRTRIARGELADGERLPVEAVLMDEFKVARATVREALRLLEVEGLITIRRGPGGGPTVRHPTIAVVAKSVGMQLQLGDVPLLQVWDVRTELVERAVTDLTGTATTDDVEHLRAVLDELAAHVQEADEFPRIWVTLTEEAVRLAGNDARLLLVRALHEITESQLLVLRHLADPEAAGRFRTAIVESCSQMVDAVAVHDAERAVEHLRFVSDGIARGAVDLLGDATVIDVFPGNPEVRARAQVDRHA